MTEMKIRPADDGADQQTFTTAPTNSDSTKFCKQCKIWKPIDQMAPDRRAKNGRRPVCRACRRDYDRRRYQSKLDAILSQQREYRQANRGVSWLANFRRRARRHGLEPIGELVTPEMIVERWGDRCFYNSEHPFELADHFIAVAAGGHHVLDNLVPCCRDCNGKKRWEIDEAAIRLFRESRAEGASNGPSDALRLP